MKREEKRREERRGEERKRGEEERRGGEERRRKRESILLMHTRTLDRVSAESSMPHQSQ
jgi:hypothetical protein